MAEWPEVEELARVLNYQGGTEGSDLILDETLPRVLQSAIDTVIEDVGDWAEDQEPTTRQAQAALRMAELLATRPEEVPGEYSRDPTYHRLLVGSRQRFGFS